MVTKAQLRNEIAGLEERVRALELEIEIDRAPRGPIPVGDYRVVIVDVERKVTRASERRYWSFKLRVVGSPYAGFCLWTNYIDVPYTRGMLTTLCRALLETSRAGWGDLWDADSEDNPIYDLVGREAVATVGQREWNGRTHNEVKRLVAP